MSADAPTGKRAKRVLLVEDNPDQAEMMLMVLELQGHQVSVAITGLSGLEAAAEGHPDVVLLDLGLPDIDGYEVARRLRDTPGLAGTPLVAVTGYGQREDRERTARAGFSHHFVKPVDLVALQRLLDDLPTRERD